MMASESPIIPDLSSSFEEVPGSPPSLDLEHDYTSKETGGESERDYYDILEVFICHSI